MPCILARQYRLQTETLVGLHDLQILELYFCIYRLPFPYLAHDHRARQHLEMAQCRKMQSGWGGGLGVF